MVRQIGNVLVFGLIAILLSSCAAGVKMFESYSLEKKREPLALENPTPLELQDVNWVIITKDNAEEVFEKIKNDKNVCAYTSYGGSFCSIFIENNIYGIQFHPEKSHSDGIQLIKNFLSI